MFSKILIANRSKIVCRVIKTARRMGIQTEDRTEQLRSLIEVTG